MSGLSLMQTRSFIDRLGDLDEEITKVCRAADVMAKGAGKDHADGVGRLKEACKALEEKQKYVREAKDTLLGLDGFMHALSGEMRQLMEHPKLGSAVSRVSEHMSGPLHGHVATIVEETVDGLRRVAAAVKALRESKEDAKREGSIKESVKALSKVCGAAENALKKALQHASAPDHVSEDDDDEEEVEAEEVVVEKAAGELGFHGYTLTAKGLPPEFLENIKKKKEEAKSKDDDGKDGDDEKKSSKKADSRVPGNESKGPKDEGEEDEGWVPGHRTTQKEKESGKKANFDHGYVLTADSKDPDPSMEEDLPGEDDDGKPVVDKSAKDKVPDLGGGTDTEGPEEGAPEDDEDPRKPKEGSSRLIEGYDLYEDPDHGYELLA